MLCVALPCLWRCSAVRRLPADRNTTTRSAALHTFLLYVRSRWIRGRPNQAERHRDIPSGIPEKGLSPCFRVMSWPAVGWAGVEEVVMITVVFQAPEPR